MNSTLSKFKRLERARILAPAAILALSAATGLTQTTLFDDNYSRNGMNSAGNLTPNFGGQTGIDVGSGITYSTFINGGSTTPPNSLNIQNSTLFKSATGQEGIWALNNNFTDSAILSAGGFSITQNILAVPVNASTPADRFCGYGVGLSLAQVNALNDDNLTSAGPRGSISGGTTGVAAYYVDLDSAGAVQIFTGGTLFDTVPISGSPTSGTLTTDFTSFADFNAGTTVQFTTFFNGTEIATASFDWTSTDNNYIAGSMRDSSVTAGEFNISTVPEPSTYTLIFSGLGLMGLLARRRKI
ncbi:MAG TPA: PEP-CTERM sorting domain-containing protein [Verrucomicrobiae bacterium]|jgi:hypothetical protein|nr:PEP-CTERM sorting domain-containing protein [Verrucomicrobiae bacterium]